MDLGTEYSYSAGGGPGVTVRGGYNTSMLKVVKGLTSFSFGVGVLFKKYYFEYAVAPFWDLGLTQRLSLSARV